MKVIVHFTCNMIGIEQYAYLIVNSIEQAEEIANKLIPRFIEENEGILYEDFIENGRENDFYSSQEYKNFIESVNKEIIVPAQESPFNTAFYKDYSN